MKKLIMTVMAMAMAMTSFSFAEDKTITAERPVVKQDKIDTNPVNINIASDVELMTLDRIGKKLAVRIIEYRNANGEFKTIENLMDVKGVGKSIFEMNKNRLTVK